MGDFVTNLVKFNSQTNGRDKLCRLAQYSCRLAWGSIQGQDKHDLVQVLKNIESVMSMTRKLLRFGKSLDFIQSALNSLHLKDDVFRLTITMSKINQACYMFVDHFLWFNNVGAVQIEKQFWSEVSARFYLITLVLNLVRDFYEVFTIIGQELAARKAKATSSEYKNGDTNHKVVEKRNATLVELLDQNKPLLIETAKNLFDLAIPLSTLKMVSLSPQTQGVYGIISSILAAVTVWEPKLKLVPS